MVSTLQTGIEIEDTEMIPVSNEESPGNKENKQSNQKANQFIIKGNFFSCNFILISYQWISHRKVLLCTCLSQLKMYVHCSLNHGSFWFNLKMIEIIVYKMFIEFEM